LREAIKQGETGRLVDFFDSQALADEVRRLLEQPQERARLGNNARQFAREHYDLNRVCLPRQLAWVEALRQLIRRNRLLHAP
jgi:glycosyltransferase involved in cell wall biosynthesis